MRWKGSEETGPHTNLAGASDCSGTDATPSFPEAYFMVIRACDEDHRHVMARWCWFRRRWRRSLSGWHAGVGSTNDGGGRSGSHLIQDGGHVASRCVVHRGKKSCVVDVLGPSSTHPRVKKLHFGFACVDLHAVLLSELLNAGVHGKAFLELIRPRIYHSSSRRVQSMRGSPSPQSAMQTGISTRGVCVRLYFL